MIVIPPVESATAEDLEALAALRVEQGWRGSKLLLAALLDSQEGRIFVIRDGQDAPAGTSAPLATTAAFAAGPAGVIGNVIVRADQRGRGLGRRIMEVALAWLYEREVRAVQLDATPDGRPLYTRLGFQPVGPSWYSHTCVSQIDWTILRSRAADARARLASPQALQALAALDWAAFGGDRLGLLERMLRGPATWLYVAGEVTAPSGYLLVRRLETPFAGARLGPWVARTPDVAAALLQAALAGDAPWQAETRAAHDDREPEFFLSLPGTSQEALALLAAIGATLIEDDLVMQLDFAAGSSEGSLDYIAVAGTPPLPVAEHPSWLYSWLAPMVF